MIWAESYGHPFLHYNVQNMCFLPIFFASFCGSLTCLAKHGYKEAMLQFTVVDLSPQCEVRLTAQYEYALLEKIPAAAELITLLATQIWRNPEEFETSLSSGSQMILRWRASSRTAGIATVRDSQQTLSLSMLVSGLDAEGDRLTLDAFQKHAVRELHDTGFEASFDLIELRQRPLIATVGLFVPQNEQDRWIFALADRCLAAVYFRKLGLA